MIKFLFAALAVGASLMLSACINLEPPLPKPGMSLAHDWPAYQATGIGQHAGPAAQEIGWRDFFTDPKLAGLIALALENNRDARVALLNVERARAQYRVARADLWPFLNLDAGAERGTAAAGPGHTLSLGVTAFELDIFGRVRSLSRAAQQRALAQEAAQRSTRLSLVAELANAYLTLAADHELLHIARTTLENRQRSLALGEKRYQSGASSGLDLAQSQTELETARNDLARYSGLVAQDINALNVLVGTPVAAEMLPDRLDFSRQNLPLLPAGFPAEVLLRRPDILQAEHSLRAANADIGAARAAFFPSISLTGSIGRASDELSSLFSEHARAWSFIPKVSLPIFQGGSLSASLAVSTADRDIALAEYEKTIQTGFREIADALALAESLAGQVQAQTALVAAAERTERLSSARYESGRDSHLVLLDAERTLYAAQQSHISTQLAEYSNRVTLYKVLGGGWKETRVPEPPAFMP